MTDEQLQELTELINDNTGEKGMGYQNRMKDELEELAGRIVRITEFLDSDTFSSLPEGDRVLLIAQAYSMNVLATILGERVRRSLLAPA